MLYYPTFELGKAGNPHSPTENLRLRTYMFCPMPFSTSAFRKKKNAQVDETYKHTPATFLARAFVPYLLPLCSAPA